MFLFSHLRFSLAYTVLALAFGSLIIATTMIYFQTGPEPAFLLEKGELRNHPVWRSAFYFHIISACICLPIGSLLMFPQMLRFRKLHMILGYFYLNSVLWFAAPSGLIMAPFAREGIFASLGFAVTGVCWWCTTWWGYRAIRNNDVNLHVRWMVRSYALALTAPIFRLIQIALLFLGFGDSTNYILSIWLSLAAAIWISESCIANKLSVSPTDVMGIRRFIPLVKKGAVR